MVQKTTELEKVLTQSEVDEANHFFKRLSTLKKKKNMPKQLHVTTK